MKTKKKNFVLKLKHSFLFLGVLLLLTSCEKEENFIDTQAHDHEILRRVSFTDFTKKVSKGTNYNKLEKFFDFNISKNKGISTNRLDENSDITIITDQIVYIQEEETAFFTFRVITETEGNEFYNLVVQVDNQGDIVKSEFFEYTPSDVWLADISQQFTGHVKKIENDFLSIDDLFSREGEQCIIGYEGGWRCGLGGTHAPGECEAETFDYVITFQWGPCETSIDDGDSSSSGGDTPGYDDGIIIEGHNDNNTGGNGGTSTTPMVVDVDILAIRLGFSFITEPEKYQWLQDNPDQAEKINQHLDDNNSIAESIEEALEFLEIIEEIPEAKFERYKELIELIENDPWVLIRDCIQQNGMDIANYQHLYDHTLPQICLDRLDVLGEGFGDQPLNTGNAVTANVDYYGVEVTTNPDFNYDGIPDSNSEVFNAYRQNFTSWASGSKDDFQFDCDVPFDDDDRAFVSWTFSPYYPIDATIWNSANPLTAIIRIDADADVLFGDAVSDDGAIMISEFTSNHWIGSTVQTFFTGTQPFSGNRQWGYLTNQNKMEIYTRAVDVARISKVVEITSGLECSEETYYNIGETTWSNLQQQIAFWINANGGQATVKPKKAVRFNKEKLKEMLESNDTIDQINCN